MREIKNLIVHHSLSYWGDGEVIKSWHCDPRPHGNGWNNPGYHVVICNGFTTYPSWKEDKPVKESDGWVDRIHPEYKIANGVKGANSDSLHVCLIGNFDTNIPTDKQLDKLVDLLVFWCKKYGLYSSNIYGHGEMQREIGDSYRKSCPGKNVDMFEIRKRVSNTLGLATVKKAIDAYEAQSPKRKIGE